MDHAWLSRDLLIVLGILECLVIGTSHPRFLARFGQWFELFLKLAGFTTSLAALAVMPDLAPHQRVPVVIASQGLALLFVSLHTLVPQANSLRRDLWLMVSRPSSRLVNPLTPTEVENLLGLDAEGRPIRESKSRV